MSYAARTVSLSVSTALWAGLLVALATVGPQVATIIPREPPSILILEYREPPAPTPRPKPTATPRPTEGAEPILTPLVVSPDIEVTPEPAAMTSSVSAEPTVITRPVWLRKPTARELELFYPGAAIRRERSGVVSLDCIVRTSGALACRVIEETPAGYGFGAAALRISESYRMVPASRDGQPVEARYMLRVPFQLH